MSHSLYRYKFLRHTFLFLRPEAKRQSQWRNLGCGSKKVDEQRFKYFRAVEFLLAWRWRQHDRL